MLAVDIDDDAAQKTAASCRSFGRPAEAFACDVADWDAMQDLAGRISDGFGPLGVLVNNAGVGMSGRLADMSVDDWRWIRSINLDGVMHGCRAFGPAMLAAGGGHVVNVSSGLAYTPTATEPAYVTTKAAVLSLSLCLRADWRSQGVGVSAVCPGVIDTPIATSTRLVGDQDSPEVRERVRKVFRRGHRPELVADAILDAVARNRGVVPVGWEARLGWWAHRLLPVASQQLIARQGPPAKKASPSLSPNVPNQSVGAPS